MKCYSGGREGDCVDSLASQENCGNESFGVHVEFWGSDVLWAKYGGMPRGEDGTLYTGFVWPRPDVSVEAIKEAFLCGPNYSLYERHLCALFTRNLIFNDETSLSRLTWNR